MTNLSGLPRRWPFLAAVVCGAISAMGLAPYYLWPLTLLGLAALGALFAGSQTPKSGAWIGWAFGLGYFANALSWIIEPFLVDPERHAWMAPFALIFMAGGLALFWGAAGWLAARLGRTTVQRVLMLIPCLSAAELLRAYVFTGFPWAGLAQVWVNNDAALILRWIGPHGLGLMTLAATIPLALVLRTDLSPRQRLACLTGLIGFAGFVALQSAPQPEFGTQVTRLVQPNAPQHQKWDPQFAPTFFDRQLEYTAADPRPDLVVWPETAVPVWLDEAAPVLNQIAQAADGVPVVLGIRRYDGQRIFNSLIHLDGQGALAGTYDKHHLVPFGEYVPLGNLAARFGLTGFANDAGQGFSPGAGPQTLDLGALGLAIPLICYEAVFPDDIRQIAPRADFLLQLTNDAWFGTRTGPYQHLAQAQMRAIEQGLPMIRAANTGISAMIDPFGRITDQIGLGEAGYVDAPLPSASAQPLYARTGDWPLGVLIAGLLFVSFLLRSRPA